MAAKTEYLHPASALRLVPAWNLVALARRGCEACRVNGSKPGGSDDAMNDETICLPILSGLQDRRYRLESWSLGQRTMRFWPGEGEI